MLGRTAAGSAVLRRVGSAKSRRFAAGKKLNRTLFYGSASCTHIHVVHGEHGRLHSSHSSISEPDPSLFDKSMLNSSLSAAELLKSGASSSTSTSGNGEDLNDLLRSDVRTMGSMLGKAIRDHTGDHIFEKVETLRNLAKEWRQAGAGRDSAQKVESDRIFRSMADFASSLTDEELFLVSRAFTHFLGVANAAEAHHRSRSNRRVLLGPSDSHQRSIRALRDARDSCGGQLYNLAESGVSRREIFDTICSQKVELVLTAHPTEVNRRTLLDKKNRVQKLLTQADAFREGASPFEHQEIDDSLSREIASIWQSDEVARVKPTPQAEAAKGTMIVETVLWDAVPSYLRKLDATMRNDLGEAYGLPLRAAPLKFASWMGGDRDGNPNVTPDVTREVCWTNREKAAGLFHRDIGELFGRLSITNCSDELRALVGDTREPYRVFLKKVLYKLSDTRLWAQQQLDELHSDRTTTLKSIDLDGVYHSKTELLDDLMVVYHSLTETGNYVEADGMLSDIIRNVSAFGLTLVPLDVRQESDRHTEALDAVTRFLGVGSYDQWDETTRVNWLQKQLSSNRPLLREGVWNDHPEIFSATAVDTLETFRMIAEQHEDSLGAYVISQATTASDVMAVLMLQRDAGVKSPLRVVPLFETLDDLNGAGATMETLFSLPAYMGSIGGKQEVMIGYSDSAKDAGRLAAVWAQFENQEKLAKVAKKFSVDLTFFHGKGGSVGRGGNPATFDAILAHAPDTINGNFRVTEQGEMINQNFGTPDRAERTLDIYTAALVAEKYTPRPSPSDEFRELMDKLSDISCEAYRRIVKGDSRFVPYFRSATPELELSSLNIGSRPAKRKAGGGVESLRAIPWIFAWTQTRLNLPTWLGVGEGLETMLDDPEDAVKVRRMYEEWDSFRTAIDLVQMVLAKSEPVIAAHYDATLVTDEKAMELGAEIRSIHKKTEDAVLRLTGQASLSENNVLLQRILAVRNPYVDPLNIMQAETLKRLRATEEGGEESEVLKDALLTTITGVANGMGNTG